MTHKARLSKARKVQSPKKIKSATKELCNGKTLAGKPCKNLVVAAGKCDPHLTQAIRAFWKETEELLGSWWTRPGLYEKVKP